MLKFAIICHHGQNVPKNIELAQKYFKKTADSGNINAMYIYGYILYNGNGVEVDKAATGHYFEMASKRGTLSATYNFAIMLYNGDGIDLNKNMAIELIDGVEADIDEAINYYQMASDSGDEESNEKLNKIAKNNSDNSTAK